MPTDADMLPCPFCGGQPYATRTVNGTQMFKVGCASCGLELKAAWYRDAEKPTKDILALWNTRAHLADVAADRARLQQQLVLGAAKLRANATTGMNGASISNWALWLETLAKDCESRSPDGDGRQATGAGRALHGSGGTTNAQDVLPAEPCRVRATEAAVQSADRTRREDGKPVDGRPAGSEPADSLSALRHALRQLPRYWVWIDRAFPEPMACLGTELSPEGEWVKYEDVQRLLTDA